MTNGLWDSEGYLLEPANWNPSLAETIAATEGIRLTAEHWQCVHLIRQFYAEYGLSPAMRPLVKYCALYLGAEKGNSIYLLKLFPGSPAKLLAKIAGLPKPANCL
jgi:tRNA 2-thiouridine synthesizing protein E